MADGIRRRIIFTDRIRVEYAGGDWCLVVFCAGWEYTPCATFSEAVTEAARHVELDLSGMSHDGR